MHGSWLEAQHRAAAEESGDAKQGSEEHSPPPRSSLVQLATIHRRLAAHFALLPTRVRRELHAAAAPFGVLSVVIGTCYCLVLVSEPYCSYLGEMWREL